MAYNGAGVFERPVADYATGNTISSSDMNTEMDGMATGLSTAITKDGQTVVTANLPMANFRHTGVGNATARTHYAAAGQVADGALTYGGVAGGTADALTIAPSPAITAYAIGQQFQFKVGSSANTGAATLNVNSVGAGAVTWPDGTALVAGDLPANAMVVVEVQAVTPVFHLIAQTLSPAAMLRINGLTAETAPATDDELPLYDTSAAANRKMTLANVLKVINALTEDTSPDVVADFLLSYDASASAVKKVLMSNVGQVVNLTSLDLTGQSAADIALDTTNYRALLVFFDAVVPTTNAANLLARVSTDSGSSFLSTGTYNHARIYGDDAATVAAAGAAADTSALVAGALSSTTASNLSGFAILVIGGAAAHATKLLWVTGWAASAGQVAVGAGYGSNSTTSQVNALRILPSTSTFASGFIHPFAILK